MTDSKDGQIQSLEEVVIHPDTIDISKDIVEAGIDSFISDDILKEIPVVKSFLGVYGIVNKVDEYFFAKKINRLLFEINEIPLEQRLKSIKEINDSKEFAGTVGERLLETLRKIESNNKPQLIGKLFRAVLNQKIEYRQFLRLCHIINLTYYDDLEWLANNNNGNYVEDDTPDSISISELITSSLHKAFEGAYGPEDGWTRKTYLTEIGKVLTEYGFK